MPTSIDPVSYDPPTKPELTGVLKPNNLLESSEIINKGTFWVALYTVRNDLTDKIHPYPFMKKLVSKLPRMLWQKPEPYGLVIALDEKGNIVRSLHDPTGNCLKAITSVKEHKGYLYMGSLYGNKIGKYKLLK